MPVTVFDKYRKIQSLYQDFKRVIKESENKEDPAMKKIEKMARTRLAKLAGDLKAGIEKLENSSDIEPGVKETLQGHQEYIKEKAKARLTDIKRKVYAMESPDRGLVVTYVILGAYKGTGKAETIYLTVLVREEMQFEHFRSYVGFHLDPMPMPDRNQTNELWDRLENRSGIPGYHSAPQGELYKTLNREALLIMGRKGYNLSGAGAQKILPELKLLMDSLKFDGQEEVENTVVENWGVHRTYRNTDFFTSRPYEEDDDFPMFTSKAEVLKRVKDHFARVLKDVKISAREQEKGWFTVSVEVAAQ